MSTRATLMGGVVGVHLRDDAASAAGPAPWRLRAERDGQATLRRIGAWANRLTRFSPDSDLARLNADPDPRVPVRPMLAAVLAAAADAHHRTGGIVDATLLDERLAAETGHHPVPERAPAVSTCASVGWTMYPDVSSPRRTIIRRSPTVRFDLDGIAKGWIADRAACALEEYAAVVVDADGDIAISMVEGETWLVGIADPKQSGASLAVLRLVGRHGLGPTRFGLATSGTSVHSWRRDGGTTHHLIDPRTGRPAVTDVVQASVLAGSARQAEALAKAAVIVGSGAAARWLDRPGIRAAVLLLDNGEVIASPSTLRWLA